jgi:hypothetical protein
VYVLLGDEPVHFVCDDEQAGQQLGLLFYGWPWQSSRQPSPKKQRRNHGPILLELLTVETLDQLPESARLVFSDECSLTNVFQSNRYWYIRYGTDAIARIPFEPSADTETVAQIQVTHKAMCANRLEDIVFSSLAPLLRRRGLFMIHAFAVERNSQALLIVGRSGSGKTTTGLSLVAHGWRYLANDVVLIRIEDDVVTALPTPGGIGLDHNSYELLSSLPRFEVFGSGHRFKHYFSAPSLVSGWASSAPISHILFPGIEVDAENKLSPASQSVTFARLLEASVDRWDRPSLGDHVRALERLCRQAKGYDLRLNRNLAQLPSMLSEISAGKSN